MRKYNERIEAEKFETYTWKITFSGSTVVNFHLAVNIPKLKSRQRLSRRQGKVDYFTLSIFLFVLLAGLAHDNFPCGPFGRQDTFVFWVLSGLRLNSQWQEIGAH
jgi:hypothetical protein